MSTGILPTISISDVPESVAEKYTATGQVGEVSLKEIANGYVSVSIPLEGVDKAGTERKITARFNVRPEWFTPGFEKSEEFESYSDNEKTSYQINMKRLARGVFAAAGLTELDFTLLEGNAVGFSVGPQSKDKSRAEVKGFFAPKK